MIIELHSSFKKSYRKRIAPHAHLVVKTEERIALFTQNPAHPLLQDHALRGKKLHLRTFSITGDIRIVYLPVLKHSVLLLDIGTHNQVY